MRHASPPAASGSFDRARVYPDSGAPATSAGSNSIGLLHSPMLCSTRLMQDQNPDDAYARVRAAAKLAKLNDATEVGIAVRAMGRKARRPYTLTPGPVRLISPWPRGGILK